MDYPPFRKPPLPSNTRTAAQGKRQTLKPARCLRILTLLLTSSVNLGKSLHRSGLQFPHLQKTDKPRVVPKDQMIQSV